MTERQKENETARFLVVNIGKGEIEGEASSQDDARAKAERLAIEQEGAVFGVYQKIGTARAETTAAWRGISG